MNNSSPEAAAAAAAGAVVVLLLAETAPAAAAAGGAAETAGEERATLPVVTAGGVGVAEVELGDAETVGAAGMRVLSTSRPSTINSRSPAYSCLSLFNSRVRLRFFTAGNTTAVAIRSEVFIQKSISKTNQTEHVNEGIPAKEGYLFTRG